MIRYYIYTGTDDNGVATELITGEQLSDEYIATHNLLEEIFDAPGDSVTIGRDANGDWESYTQADVMAKVNAGELPI